MLDERGWEIPDGTPMARPLHINVAETLADKIKRMVRYELSQSAAAAGHESFEDADDFNVGDDPELSSPYELSDQQFGEEYGNGRKDAQSQAELRAGMQANGPSSGNAGEGGSPGAGNAKGSSGDPGQAGKGNEGNGTHVA